MSGLEDLLNQWGDTIKTTGAVVIGLLAIAFILYHIVKAIMASKQAKMQDVSKHVMWAVGVALLAAVGITGVIGLVEIMKPDDSILPTDNFGSLTGK